MDSKQAVQSFGWDRLVRIVLVGLASTCLCGLLAVVCPGVARAQACNEPTGCPGIWYLQIYGNIDIHCNTACSDQYAACLAGLPGGYIGLVDCCARDFDICLCGCPPPAADTGNPGPSCPSGGCSDPNAPNVGAPNVADPVDAATGLFLYDHTDLELKDVMPIELSRSYRELDAQNRTFGIGMALGYDLQIIPDLSETVVAFNGHNYSVPNFAYADLILPNGRRIRYPRISPGNFFAYARFQNTNAPGEFFGSILTAVGSGGWVLALRDGTLMTFDSRAALTSITDRNNNLVSIIRDGGVNNYVTAIISPNGRWISLTYDSNNRVTQALDNANRTVSYGYDSNGRLQQVTDAKQGITTYAYDSAGRMYSITDPRGNVYVTNNQYDSNNRVTLQTDANGKRYTFSYPPGSVITTEYTDPNLFVRHMEFNSSGFLTKDVLAQNQPEQQTTTYVRDPNTNLVQSQTDQLGRTTSYTYDGVGNTMSVTQLAGTSQPVTTHYTYDPVFSQITSLKDPLNHTWTVGLDSHGNATSITDPLQHATSANYNAEGQMTSFSDALTPPNTTQIGYTDGNLTSIADPLGNTSYFFSDGAGRTIWTRDPMGSRTNLTYSTMDELTQSLDEDGNPTTFAYDPDRNLGSVTDANGGQTSYSYDSMDRLHLRTDPLQVTEVYGYDGNGNLISHTDRRGKVTKYQYDGLNRRTFAGYGYTGSSYESTISYNWDGGDHLTQAVDSIAGTIMRQFGDGLDDLTDEQTPQGEVGYVYDIARRRQSMTVVGQPQVSYSWDNANRLQGITQGTSSVGFGYDTANRRSTLTLPNGIVLTYTYDNDSRVTGMTWNLGSTAVGDLEYQYDADGRVTQRTGSLAQGVLPTALSGNTFNAANEMAAFNGITLSYDANGNLTNDGTNSYAWDARNHLTGITGASTSSFVYDPLGRRAQKTINGTSTQFLYDGLNPVQEIQNGAPSANMLTGLRIDEYFQRIDASGSSSYLSDALGSTLGLANASGSIGTTYRYQPFGKTTASGQSSSNPYQFTGRENDGTGLYFYRARYYGPTLQRFVAQDPIGFGGGGPNLYGYVFNGPTNFRDPLGLCDNDMLCAQEPTPTATPTPDISDPVSLLAAPPSNSGYYCAAPPPPPPPPPCFGTIDPEGVGALIGLPALAGFEICGPWCVVIGGGIGVVGGTWAWWQAQLACEGP